jgi:hypothetical protein
VIAISWTLAWAEETQAESSCIVIVRWVMRLGGEEALAPGLASGSDSRMGAEDKKVQVVDGRLAPNFVT